MRGNRFASILLCLILTSSNFCFSSDTLVSFNSHWRYRDNGTAPSTNWKILSYVDTTWDVGQAEFGYGDGDETTVISYGSDPNDKYITTYFRREFSVANISSYKSLLLHLLRDDGAIVYLNGSEVYRSNMPSGTITNSTLAASGIAALEETNTVLASIDLSSLQNGYNLIAVELHQNSITNNDATFDLALVADTSAQLIRGPYLQMATPNSMMVCWRTSSPDISKILLGTSQTFSDTIKDLNVKTDHFINISGLQPSTKYYYAICSSHETLHSDGETFFITPPSPNSNQPVRIWTMGDFGIGNVEQNSTRDSYYNYTDTTYTNIFLMLGDNAYSDGSDESYSTQVFKDHYEDLLKQTVVYSTCGNHELESSSSTFQSGPYYDIFSFPKNGEGGGIPSGSEAYYSFDYGNIHFVCLESNVDSFGSTNLSTMLSWLDADLSANNKKWTIAYYHFPPLSKGYHDSDDNNTEIWCRENINPILESYNVDLVLGGHSHDYERSHLLKGHFGLSSTLLPSMIVNSTGGAPPNYYNKTSAQDSGTVYAVVGNSSEITPIQSDWPHPAMYKSIANDFGSMVIDVKGDTMEVKFLSNSGSISDHFVYVKVSTVNPVTNEILRGPYLQIAAPDEMTVRWNTTDPGATKLLFGTSLAYSDSLIDLTDVREHTVRLQNLTQNTKYYYAIRLANDSLIGDSTFYFYTPAVDGSIMPVRIWAMGDFGTGNAQQDEIRDAYYNYSESTYTNLLLWLGNNAYPTGSFADYNSKVFSRFNSILKNSCVYSTCGNIELLNASASTATGDYFDLFNFPIHGEAGGLSSNSESYYSFNYGNIHFVSLESNIDSFGTTNLNLMINWLNADLAANTQKWTIILFHYPPYTKGSTDSDNNSNMIMCRTVLVPIIEAHNVDLIMSSHSKTYERSILMKRHYGAAATFDPPTMAVDTTSGTPPDYYNKSSSSVKGAVFTVLSSQNGTLPVQPGWPHPAMYVSMDTTSGSLVLDVFGDTLNVRYLTSTNNIADHYAILKHTPSTVIKDQPVESGKLLLYPDPVNSNLTIQYIGNVDEKITISIYNSMGQSLQNREFIGKYYVETADVSRLNNGVYFIRLQGKQTNIIKRFVKN